jgi:putative tryptophan/tyrosine transport system substrate-binding protein
VQPVRRLWHECDLRAAPTNVLRAQQLGRLQRIALLTLVSPQELAPEVAAFLDGLHRLGYMEGQNVSIDYRYAEGDVSRLKPLA